MQEEQCLTSCRKVRAESSRFQQTTQALSMVDAKVSVDGCARSVAVSQKIHGRQHTTFMMSLALAALTVYSFQVPTPTLALQSGVFLLPV
jgi:hypothetical protein